MGGTSALFLRETCPGSFAVRYPLPLPPVLLRSILHDRCCRDYRHFSRTTERTRHATNSLSGSGSHSSFLSPASQEPAPLRILPPRRVSLPCAERMPAPFSC